MISFVGSQVANTTSLTPVGGAALDIEVAWASRTGSATAPGVASEWKLIGTTTGNNCSAILAYRIAFGTAAVATGAFANANELIVTRHRGVLGLGAVNFGTGSSTSLTFPALSALVQNGGKSTILIGSMHRTATNLGTAPAGFTNRAVTSNGLAAVHEKAGATSHSSVSQTVNANSGYQTFALELLGANSTFNPYDKGATDTLSNGNLTVSTTAGGDNLARVGLGRNDSTIYVFEFVIGHNSGDDDGASEQGIATGAASLTTYLTSSAEGAAWEFYGEVWCNNLLMGTLDTYQDGDRIQYGFQPSTKSFWGRNMTRGSGEWNGVPGAVLGDDNAIILTELNDGPYFPTVGLGVSGESTTYTGRPTTMPAGGTPWDGLPDPVGVPSSQAVLVL